MSTRSTIAGAARVFLCLCAASAASWAQENPRARDLGIQLDGTPGLLNAITDVAGVEVVHTTLIQGAGRLVQGSGPVRTGITAIFPRGRAGSDTAFAGWFTLNGNGEMTGTTWIEESGMLESPVLITNTHSVGVVRDATVDWMARNGRAPSFALPVVAETFDGLLNDDKGFHVKPEHVYAALDGASSGRVEEGNVGGGTGMIGQGFKGGIGTASRTLHARAGGYAVGVLVQCNYGSRRLFRVDGVPVGREISDLRILLRVTSASRESPLWWDPDLRRASGFGADWAVGRGRTRFGWIGLDHHHRGDGCAPTAPPAEARGQASGSRCRQDGRPG